MQAKKKGITWIKPSYLRKIDFVAVLESVDTLNEAGEENPIDKNQNGANEGGQLVTFPSETSGMTLSKLRVPSLTILIQKFQF